MSHLSLKTTMPALYGQGQSQITVSEGDHGSVVVGLQQPGENYDKATIALYPHVWDQVFGFMEIIRSARRHER